MNNPKKIILLITALLCATSIYAQQDSLYKAYISQAEEQFYKKAYIEAANYYTKAFEALGNKGYTNDRYNAACAWAQAGNSDNAFHNLFRIAEKADFSSYTHMVIDRDLNPIKEDTRWNEVLQIVKNNKAAKEEGLDHELIAQLDSIRILDQMYRMEIEHTTETYGRESEELKELWSTINYYDSVNLIKIEQIIEEHGFPGRDLIGINNSNVIFLVIQHSDTKTQQKYLPMMRQAVEDHNLAASSLALLEDRVALNTGGKQIYGSQIWSDETGAYFVAPIEDPEHVNERRKRVGLQPLEEYTMIWNFKWDVEAHIKRHSKSEK